MFKKCVVFTDIHLGLKSDSEVHNNDCIQYIDWMIEQAKDFGAETAIFCGDFHHNRSNINIRTMNHSVSILEKLSKSFDSVYMIIGNHDVFFRNSIETHSLRFGNHIDNIHIIDKLTTIDNCVMMPWVVGEEYNQVKTINADYMFCHLELPDFFMNSKVIMPKSDHCSLTKDDITGIKYILSGHFHKRQTAKNKNGNEIIYLGNCFPHNYADVDDFERGCVLIENGKPPIFRDWDDCPKYRIKKLSTVLRAPSSFLCEKTHIKVEVDMDLTFLEMSYIKDELSRFFKVREFVLIQAQNAEETVNSDIDVKLNSIDEIICGYIKGLDTESFDTSVLLDIYGGL